MDTDDKKSQKEGLNMPATVTKNENIDIKSSLKKIASKLPILEGKENKIKLDPNDKHHKEWIEDDGVE